MERRQLELHGTHGERIRALEAKLESCATQKQLSDLESKLAWRVTTAAVACVGALLVSVVRLLGVV